MEYPDQVRKRCSRCDRIYYDYPDVGSPYCSGCWGIVRNIRVRENKRVEKLEKENKRLKKKLKEG